MYILYNYGFNNDVVDEMIDKEPEIQTLDDMEIVEKLALLEAANIETDVIIDAVAENPEYLMSDTTDVAKLINALMTIGIDDLGEVLTSNPMVLNCSYDDVEDFIEREYECGYEMSEIIEMIKDGKLWK